MEWENALDIHERVVKLLDKLGFNYIKSSRLFCFRSFGSSSRARARIWSLPRVWQHALSVDPAYVIEVLSEKFDNLSQEAQTKILIHELLHIPKTFSGALRPHNGRYVRVDDRMVDRLFRQYKKNLVEK